MTPDDIKVSGLLTAEQVNDAWKVVIKTLVRVSVMCPEANIGHCVTKAMELLQEEFYFLEAHEFQAMQHELETREEPVPF